MPAQKGLDEKGEDGDADPSRDEQMVYPGPAAPAAGGRKEEAVSKRPERLQPRAWRLARELARPLADDFVENLDQALSPGRNPVDAHGPAQERVTAVTHLQHDELARTRGARDRGSRERQEEMIRVDAFVADDRSGEVERHVRGGLYHKGGRGTTKGEGRDRFGRGSGRVVPSPRMTAPKLSTLRCRASTAGSSWLSSSGS